MCNEMSIGYRLKLKVKGPNIMLFTGSGGFTMRSGVRIRISSRQRSAIGDRPLPIYERTFDPQSAARESHVVS